MMSSATKEASTGAARQEVQRQEVKLKWQRQTHCRQRSKKGARGRCRMGSQEKKRCEKAYGEAKEQVEGKPNCKIAIGSPEKGKGKGKEERHARTPKRFF
jgi:hypothetical protein